MEAKEVTTTETKIQNYDTLKKIVEQLKFCNYQTPDGNHAIENNVAFLALERAAHNPVYAAADDLFKALTGIIPFASQWININHPAMIAAKAAIDKAITPIQEATLEKGWENSSTVVKTTYNNPESTLIVEFKNGQRYRYSEFPESAWQELILVESIGSYVHKKLKGNYPVMQLPAL